MRKLEMLKLFDLVKERYNFPYTLKDEQAEALLHLMNGENVVIVAPTGFGKTDIFTIYPLLLDIHRPLAHGNYVTIVISPLTALIEDQFNNIKRKKVSVVALRSPKDYSAEELKGIHNGEYSVVLVTPEALLQVNYWRKNILHNKIYEQRTCVIALDEAHVISKWGTTFRRAYNALDEVRACLVDTRMLFLTATVTTRDLRECLAALQTNLSQVKVVAKVADRPNIFLGFKSEKDMEFLPELGWYLKRLKTDQIWTPKCILYVSSLTVAGVLFGQIKKHLKKDVYYGTPSTRTRMVAMYHGESEDEDQRSVLADFSSNDGNVRLVIATVAFGMGINIPDIQYVIHWGPPVTLLDYWQEVGRAGRDGAKAFCHFLAVKSKISQGSEDLRKLIHNINENKVECIRVAVLSSLELPEMDQRHLKDLTKRQMCQSSQTCKDDEECMCSLCWCCTLCRTRCKCPNKVKCVNKI